MRTVTIAPVRRTPLPVILGTFTASFGLVWLFVEPIAPALPASVWLIYTTMLAIATLASLLATKLWRHLAGSHTQWLTFVVKSASDGEEYCIRSPVHMLVSDFISGFLDHLQKGAAAATVRALMRTHRPVLQIHENGKKRAVEASKSLVEAGVVSGSICSVVGEPIEPKVSFCFDDSDSLPFDFRLTGPS